MQSEKLWSRTFIVLMGVNFCSALSFYLVMVKITEFAVDVYGVSQGVGGFLVSIYVIFALLTRLFFGKRIDSWGVKRALAVGTIANTACMALYLAPLPFGLLVAVRAVHGFSFAIMSGSAATGAALVIPRDRYGEGVGYFSMMQALATGIGPFIAILITSVLGGYTAMFAVATIIAAVAMASVALLQIPVVERDATQDGDSGRQGTTTRRGLKTLIQWSAIPLGTVLLMCYLGYAGILSFITLYAGDLGLDKAVSLFFIVYAAVILISRPPIGRKVDRSGENSVIYWCFASLAAGFIVLGFAMNGAMLLAAAALTGFGIGATQSITQAVIARETPIRELGRANSTFFMSMDLGTGVGPLAIGAIIPFVGYGASYLVLAAIAVAAGVVYHLVHGRKQSQR